MHKMKTLCISKIEVSPKAEEEISFKVEKGFRERLGARRFGI